MHRFRYCNMEIKKEIIGATAELLKECVELPVTSDDEETMGMVTLVLGQIKTATLMIKCVAGYEGDK